MTALPFAGYGLAAVALRYRNANRRPAVRAPLPDGKLPALFAACTGAIGGCAFGFVLLT